MKELLFTKEQKQILEHLPKVINIFNIIIEVKITFLF